MHEYVELTPHQRGAYDYVKSVLGESHIQAMIAALAVTGR